MTPWTVTTRLLCLWDFWEWVGWILQEYWSGLPFPTPRGSSQPRDWTCLHLLHCRWILYHWTTREALYKLYGQPYKSLWNKDKTNYTHSYFWYLIQPHQKFGYDFLPEIVQSVTQFESWVPVRPWFLPFDLFFHVSGTYSPLQILNLLSDKIFSADGFGSIAANS